MGSHTSVHEVGQAIRLGNASDLDLQDLYSGSYNVSGDNTVSKVIQVTQAEYDALTPASTTLYVIVG